MRFYQKYQTHVTTSKYQTHMLVLCVSVSYCTLPIACMNTTSQNWLQQHSVFATLSLCVLLVTRVVASSDCASQTVSISQWSLGQVAASRAVSSQRS